MSVTNEKIAYGEGEFQHGFLTTPDALATTPLPTVVLIHGGFWKEAFAADLMDSLAEDLHDRGFLVWNIEYRRVGHDGGGYPGTLEDVAAAVDHLVVLADDHAIDLDRVAVVGHSAGGHLALWVNSRSELDPGAPGAGPKVEPTLIVAQAPVANLVDAASAGLGSNATQAFLGGEPTDVPDFYAVAQPKLDVGRVVYVHGTDDINVPPSQSIDAAAIGGQLILLEETDHFDVIDPASVAWAEIVAVLEVLQDG